MAASVVRTADWAMGQASVAHLDLPRGVERLQRVTPERVVVRYRDRVLNYRDLNAAITVMMPVTRSQQMDDHSAVVAAIFAGLPALGSEAEAAVVAAVVDGAIERIISDLGEFPADVPPAKPTRASRTSEIDLRVIASRMSGA